ncbi:hypothetical protein V8C35DRAFT_52838 [Trichoderma chlorosporum]
MGGEREGKEERHEGMSRGGTTTALRPFAPSTLSEASPRETGGNRGEDFKQVLRTMVNLASLLGILASATTLVVLVALGRIAFGRQLASLHHLASLGIHRTRRRGGGGGGSGGGGRSTGSLPLAHCCCARSILFSFSPSGCPCFFSFQSRWVFFRLSLSLSLFSHLPIARPPIGSVCLGKGYANVQTADHRTGKSLPAFRLVQRPPDGATSMPEAVQPSPPTAEAEAAAQAGAPPSLSRSANEVV